MLFSGVGKQMSSELKYTNVTIISNINCNSFYKSFNITIKPSMLCVSTAGGSGPCSVSIHSAVAAYTVLTFNPVQGDSGGPLVVREFDRSHTLVGVVSFGNSRGCTLGTPEVFTRITSFLHDPFLAQQLNKPI
jgi:secreted trypsin-like serine protease